MKFRMIISLFFLILLTSLFSQDFGCTNIDENIININNDTNNNTYFITYKDKKYYVNYLSNNYNPSLIGEFSSDDVKIFNPVLEFPNYRTVRFSFYTFNKSKTLKIYFYVDFPKGKETKYTFTERILDKKKTEKAKNIPIKYEMNNYEVSPDVVEKTEAAYKKVFLNESISSLQNTKYTQFDSSFVATVLTCDKNNDAFIFLAFLTKKGDIKNYVKIPIPNEQDDYQIYTSANRIYINLLTQTVAANWSFSRIYIIDKKGKSVIKYKLNSTAKKLRETLSNNNITYLKTVLDSLVQHNKTDKESDLKKYTEDEMILYNLFKTFYKDQLQNGFNVNINLDNTAKAAKYYVLKHRVNVTLVEPEAINHNKNLNKIARKIGQKYYFKPDLDIPDRKIIYLTKDNEITLTEAFSNDMKPQISKLLNVSKGIGQISPNLIIETNIITILLSKDFDKAVIITNFNGIEYKYVYRFINDSWQYYEQ